MSKNFEIAPKFRRSNWINLKLDESQLTDDWLLAIDTLKMRINERFLFPADELIRLGNDGNGNLQRFGFATLALDFIVLETVQGFREGKREHRGCSGQLCVNFLIRCQSFKTLFGSDAQARKVAGNIFDWCRCGIHHSGSTNNNLIVCASGSIFQLVGDQLAKINRTKFHSMIKDEFDSYLEELRQPNMIELRQKFRAKMDFISGYAR